MVRVKICGITNIEDAMAAVEAGADALGFVFAESPRKVTPETALSIVQELPPFVTTVGVFADQAAGEVLGIMEKTGLYLAQLHGDVGGKDALPPKGLPWDRLIRALRIRSEEDIPSAARDSMTMKCAAVLLDTHVEGLMGGTGTTFDWDLAAKARTLNKPIILAGGLTPANVEEAVRRVCPYAVDVSTGVEASPGRKDRAKVKEFIKNAKKCA